MYVASGRGYFLNNVTQGSDRTNFKYEHAAKTLDSILAAPPSRPCWRFLHIREMREEGGGTLCRNPWTTGWPVIDESLRPSELPEALQVRGGSVIKFLAPLQS